ncbi:hypothetical protein HW450_10480 [Corynebacterium hindlerae]|uniref:Uncharacterized protein n=1 Tax=Corynebacterium hindlerae TaxID=699041 RepID=A0A7G5FDR5_9CORY|nr:hypothetical protein [Corynebacterium hindlerae]QMV84756.1 hypothetical protein HW450_10480 [Corynebacterium hindlerae]
MLPAFKVSQGERGLRSLLQRAVALDARALVRVQPLAGGALDVFVTTPFEVLASRRVLGEVSGDAVFLAQQLIDGQLSPSPVAAWPGALPPATGFVELDVLPVDVVHELAEQGRALARQFSGPLGPPKSLLDQRVLRVEGDGGIAEVSMRAIFTCTSLGLIPGIATHPDLPRHLRVASKGRWVRIDAPFGSVYESRGINLLV